MKFFGDKFLSILIDDFSEIGIGDIYKLCSDIRNQLDFLDDSSEIEITCSYDLYYHLRDQYFMENGYAFHASMFVNSLFIIHKKNCRVYRHGADLDFDKSYILYDINYPSKIKDGDFNINFSNGTVYIKGK